MNKLADRLAHIPGFAIDNVAAAAGKDPEVLRLENLDTDLRPPQVALEVVNDSVRDDDANSYLPFTGRRALRRAAAWHVSKLSSQDWDPDAECVITAGGTEGMLDTLLATVNPGDEVVLTDPTYAGMIYRVRLAGGYPVLVPFERTEGRFCLDIARLRQSVGKRTRAIFVMNPSIPSGAVLTKEEWSTICELCREHDLWLIYNAAMERILFDGREYRHPASFDGMRDRVITIGSVSKEYRMIGWRVGWVVGPRDVIEGIARVHIYNVVSPVGIAQMAAAAVLDKGGGLSECLDTWQRRRDAITAELGSEQVVPAEGGWSMLYDAHAVGMSASELSDRLLRLAKIAATPMGAWGAVHGDRYLRLVFSNEPVERLKGIGARFAAAVK